MQDKDYNKLSEKGWDQMKGILDKEMPVRRRRFPIFIFIGLLFIMTLGGLGYSLSNSSQQSEPEIQKVNSSASSYASVDQENKQASAESSLDHSEGEKLKFTQTLAASDEAEAGDSNSNLPDPKEKDLNPAIDNTNAANSILTVKTISSKSSKPSAVNPLDANSLNFSDRYKEKSIDPTSTQSSSISNINAFRLEENVNTLTGGDKIKKGDTGKVYKKLEIPGVIRLGGIEILNLDGKSETPLQAPVMVDEVNYRNWGLLASIQYDFPLSSSIYGVELGLAAERFINRRWSLDAGITYANYRYNNQFYQSGLLRGTLENDLLADANTETPEQDVPNNFQDGEQVVLDEQQYVKSELLEGIVESTRSMSFVSIPLHINYRLRPHVLLTTGVKYSYLANAGNTGFTVDENSGFLLNTQGEISFQAGELYSSGVFNKHFLSYSGSFTYLINGRMGINLELQANGSDLLRSKSPNFKNNTISSIGLGLNYRL